MKTEFVLRIDIANDATLGDANLADILKKVAEEIAWVGIQDNRRFQIRDVYGNVVGHYGRFSSECDHERTRMDDGISSCLDCGDRIDTDADEEGSCPDRIAFGSCDHDSCKEAD
jgi:hypothetical protein